MEDYDDELEEDDMEEHKGASMSDEFNTTLNTVENIDRTLSAYHILLSKGMIANLGRCF